ncbi:MAG: hypothetical protein K2G87_03940 [Oscillospiraceae bacterium]|nr:hypothetical protein [Oscillospiraceae bacterium]
MIEIAFTAFGVLFVLIGIGVLIGGLANNNAMKNSREVSGTIVDFIKRRGRGQHGRMHTYIYPVYEYYDDGETKRHESNVSVMPPKPLGTETTLYISEDGKVREKQSASIMILVGSIFAVIGAIFAVLSLVMF